MDAAPAQPQAAQAPELVELATELDRVLADAASDLGLAPGTLEKTRIIEASEAEALLFLRADRFIVLPTVAIIQQRPYVRLWARHARAPRVNLVRFEATPDDFEVSAIRALQEVILEHAPATRPGAEAPAPPKPEPSFSRGQVILAANGALIGGYLGFSFEHLGGASDARLLYPVMALGAGIGLGTSLVVAGEWDISIPEAWYLSAASTWPTLSALMMVSAIKRDVGDDRFSYGLIGTGIGITLGGLALQTGEVRDGGALFVHSGAIFGGLLGGVAERLAVPIANHRPLLGAGIGLAAGTVLTGALAPHLSSLPASRVLTVDLSATLGALLGAAVASPFLVGSNVKDTENRLWFGSIGVGALVGTGLGIWLTQPAADKPEHAPTLTGQAASWLQGWSADIYPRFETGMPTVVNLGVKRAW